MTEIHYNPGPADPEGRRREFVEVFNTSPEPLDLTGYSFTRGLTYTVPEGTWIAGHAYLVFCADPNYVRTTYSITNTLGPWAADGSLANGGETIAIAEPSGAEVARVRYNDRGNWPGAADGTGHSLALVYPYSELNDPDSWAHSSVRGGSPGKANPAPGARPVSFNEALTLTSGQRWVELYNPSAAAVSLTNYHLTDDPLNLTKAKLGASATVPAKGWLTLTDTELGLSFAPVPNPPNPGAGRVFIALVDAAGTRVVDAYTFEPDLPELTEARYPDGNEDWADASTPTPGAANQVEVETDVVINELLYHSHDDDPSDEFIELYNRGAQAVSLAGCRFSQGIDFDLPAVSIAAGGYLVVARKQGPDIDGQRTSLTGVTGVFIASVSLVNGGEQLTLYDVDGDIVD
ncbi:MAG: lamin tail domain-containing protein, partial [Acidimicrobiales bacterium]